MKYNERVTYVEIGNIYFWTASINSFKHLLKDDSCKEIIIDSLKYLSDKTKMDIFGFVIMPNHLHLIFRVNEMNGKEMPHVSFLKFTAHSFKNKLSVDKPIFLEQFKVDAFNKKYEFWQRDSLAIELISKEMAYQKLDYTHNNPLIEKWNLVGKSGDYFYSSYNFYEKGDDSFSFLKDLRLEY